MSSGSHGEAQIIVGNDDGALQRRGGDAVVPGIHHRILVGDGADLHAQRVARQRGVEGIACRARFTGEYPIRLTDQMLAAQPQLTLLREGRAVKI